MEHFEYNITEVYEALQSIYRAKEEKELDDFNQAIIRLREFSETMNCINSFDEIS